MSKHTDKKQDNKNQATERNSSQRQSNDAVNFKLSDNRPEAAAQRKRQEVMNNSPQVRQLKSIQEIANNSPQAKRGAQLQAMADNHSSQQELPIQKTKNKTGLPDHLKTGIENLSGFSMNDVSVHYNSEKPAQLEAKAYAQGTDIHVASGEEKHLPHEAWHVVQQKQERVRPTFQMKGNVNVNDNTELEKEADMMGAKANKNVMGTQEGMVGALAPGTKAAGPVQMAGHAGVMIFGNGGRLFKRVERNEADQFNNVMAMQSAEDRLGNKSMTRGAFPKIYKVLSADQLDADEVKHDYGTGKNVTEWLAKGKASDQYVEMESLGGRDFDVLDFKIGTATADHEELMDNYGKTQKKADAKVAKMAKIDTTTETASYGLRDSDAAKSSIWDNIKRIVGGKFIPTLTDITSRVERDPRPYAEDDQAITDLRNIRDYIRGADIVYIASSLVMQWSKDRAYKELDRVVLIDLAHPMPDDMGGFEEAKNGMLLGIANLERILLGNRPSLAPAPQ